MNRSKINEKPTKGSNSRSQYSYKLKNALVDSVTCERQAVVVTVIDNKIRFSCGLKVLKEIDVPSGTFSYTRTIEDVSMVCFMPNSMPPRGFASVIFVNGQPVCFWRTSKSEQQGKKLLVWVYEN